MIVNRCDEYLYNLLYKWTAKMVDDSGNGRVSCFFTYMRFFLLIITCMFHTKSQSKNGAFSIVLSHFS